MNFKCQYIFEKKFFWSKEAKMGQKSPHALTKWGVNSIIDLDIMFFAVLWRQNCIRGRK